jgi:cytochrome d ubiquinol oxidase subunit II
MAYLWAAILLYLIMGGADFGAGIIELMSSERNQRRIRKTMYQAIGPIWEANHMWLIITIVVLFVGFPLIYTTVSTYLHIPLVIMLFGIIARGTAFAFRHYDAVQDGMLRVYNKIFVYSSFVTPLFLGIIAASAVSGRIDAHADNFLDAYIFSWLNVFSIAVGAFTISICGFLAAIFIIGETENEIDRMRYVRKAKHMNFAAAITGILVFVAAYFDEVPLLRWVFGNAISAGAIIAAAISLAALWYFIKHRNNRIIRVLAGFQVAMILLAITYTHYPNIILLKGGEQLSLIETAGHEKTIQSLAIALLLGSVFILPALVYLLYSFHNKKADEFIAGSKQP